MGVVGELCVEGELLARIDAAVVELCAPDGERAQHLAHHSSLR
jgi:hypothetical protein